MLLGAVSMSYLQILVWPGGGYVGMVLWMMSIVMVAVIVQNFLIVRRTIVMPDLIRQQVQEFFANKQYREAIQLTSNEPSFYSYVVHAGLSQAPYGYAAMARAVAEATDERTSKLLRGAEWLNLLGNIGPMVGLLGTVWGLIMTFFAIVKAGGMPKPEDLAGAIGIKLVCTLLGLVIAIPSLGVYGIMRNRIDTLSAETLVAAQELIGTFKPGAKKTAE